MRIDTFDYDLPEELIATEPTEARDGARLLSLLPDGVTHGAVRDLPSHVRPGDLLVINDTRVRAARVYGNRLRADGSLGGRVEALFLKRLSADAAGVEHWSALGRGSKPLKVGDRLLLGGGEGGNARTAVEVAVEGKHADGELLLAVRGDVEALLERAGAMPLPPYMKRPAEAADRERYQTVYARELGSAAAPTAGLHFTNELLSAIEARGAEIARVTLHVGLGTFRPVEVEDLDDHSMHAEEISVDGAVAEAIRRTRARGGRVVAIGTTSLRALESAAHPELSGEVRLVDRQQTRLLIQPGYEFRVVDALFTNFHMPRSTLLALVSAFAGTARVLRAYRTAVRERYRFFSYGDAMWIPGRMS